MQISPQTETPSPVIGVVGPCTAGKTTLVAGLLQRGWTARQISQEHSFVQDMWQKVTNPDILIYLDVSFAEALHRRPQSFQPADHREQVRRLEHARAHAHLYIHTDSQNQEQILEQVIAYLEESTGKTPTQPPEREPT